MELLTKLVSRPQADAANPWKRHGRQRRNLVRIGHRRCMAGVQGKVFRALLKDRLLTVPEIQECVPGADAISVYTALAALTHHGRAVCIRDNPQEPQMFCIARPDGDRVATQINSKERS